MNYFELFGIPEAPRADKHIVARKYFELQKKYHPDFHTQSAEDDQADMLERSSMVNKAYKTFLDDDATIRYFLQLKGLLEEEEKYQLPPDFLAEMMELNEALSDAKMEEDQKQLQDVRETIINSQSLIYEPVKAIVENYREGAVAKEELLQMKDYYFKKKYLLRLLEQLD